MNIIYLGCNGFPFGFAQVQKQKMISRALLDSDNKIIVISSKGVFEKSRNSKINFKGEYNGVKYYFTSLTAYRPKIFLLRNFLKITGYFFEFLLIIYKTSSTEKNVAIITTNSLIKLIYYRIILKLLNYKIILSYEEFWKSTFLEKNKNSFNYKFDDLASKYCDAFLPISTFLSDYQKSINKQVKLLKIPALTDFDLIDNIKNENEKLNQILFCGASAYRETIEFIIKAFDLIENKNIKLILIIHGDKNQNEIINNLVRCSINIDRVKVVSNLDYNELIKMYKSSKLLLIPLNNNFRDIARFPHKISEYTASKTPIVTTAIGEINSFFTDNENAFIAEDYDIVLYANKINFALENPIFCNKIALNAYKIGRINFDYKSISKKLNDFILHL